MGSDRRTIAKSVLMSAVAIAAVAMADSASAQMNPQMEQKLDQIMKLHPGADQQTIVGNMGRMMNSRLVRCYGVNAVGKNDCAAGAHSCAGQSGKARDPEAFILVPRGSCLKIAGGSLEGPM
jgi:uncharacterized membrane protein